MRISKVKKLMRRAYLSGWVDRASKIIKPSKEVKKILKEETAPKKKNKVV